jgi:DNA-binding LacI/PurR family transcriptional regulator
VAAAADVCVMTVSLALRDNPRISAGTRDRIKRLAAELGYHPDPELSRLMNHLRASRTARGRIGVALIDFYPTPGFVENVYNAKIRLGAERRAEALGFSITAMHAADYKLSLPNLLKVIRTRGLEGALLLPSLVPTELDTAVNWNGISVVATSKSILAPRFHCVVPNQFGNTMRLLETLQGHGHRRICAVFDELFDERTGHNFTAALNWKPEGRSTLIVPQTASPSDRAGLVAGWLAEQRPDAVFAQSDAVMSALPRIRSVRPRMNFQVVSLGEHNSAGFSYLDERADLVGSAAIDLLGGMMYYHETGIPAHPRTTLIDGKLVLSRKVVGRAPALTIGDRGLRIAE